MSAVIFRQAVESDLGFIYSTYLRDLHDSDPGALPDEFWYPAHRAHLDRLIGKCDTVIIAAAADRPTEILGYVIADSTQGVLWWIHVRKGPLRGKGIAKQLLVQAKVTQDFLAAWKTRDSKMLRNRSAGRACRKLSPQK